MAFLQGGAAHADCPVSAEKSIGVFDYVLVLFKPPWALLLVFTRLILSIPFITLGSLSSRFASHFSGLRPSLVTRFPHVGLIQAAALLPAVPQPRTSQANGEWSVFPLCFLLPCLSVALLCPHGWHREASDNINAMFNVPHELNQIRESLFLL